MTEPRWRFLPRPSDGRCGSVNFLRFEESLIISQLNLLFFLSPQWNSAPKTQNNLLCPGLFCPHRHEVRKALALSILFLVDIQQRWLRTHSWWHTWTLVCTLQKHENPPSIIALSGSSYCTWNCIFTHSVRHAGLARDRNTNPRLGTLVTETMWCPQILINSWLPWSFYNPTFTFPPVPLSIANEAHEPVRAQILENCAGFRG
jgi:hypothetical protein